MTKETDMVANNIEIAPNKPLPNEKGVTTHDTNMSLHVSFCFVDGPPVLTEAVEDEDVWRVGWDDDGLLSRRGSDSSFPVAILSFHIIISGTSIEL